MCQYFSSVSVDGVNTVYIRLCNNIITFYNLISDRIPGGRFKFNFNFLHEIL